MAFQNNALAGPEAARFFEDCLKAMPDVAARLTSSIAGRESDFLELGAGLQQIASRAEQMTQHTASLTEQTSGQAVAQFIQDLTNELTGMHQVCDDSASERNIAELQNILSTLSTLIELIAKFKRIVRTLQMLGISTRIESARLGEDGRGFTTLSDDVEGLGLNIEDNSAKILDKSRSLETLAAAATNESNLMREGQRVCSLGIFVSIRENLDSLQSLSRNSQAISSTLAERTADIAMHIGEVVSSLQFHDIIRQQVEHVCESLADMTTVIRENGISSSGDIDKRVELVGWIADVCSVQISQLKNGGERFIGAVESLKSGLNEIARNVQLTQDSLEELTGARNDERILSRIEESIQEVISSMHSFTAQGARIGDVMGSVAQTVKEIGSFLYNIEEIGSEIELIAINASVKAAHTGDKGKALGVLASACQQLSQNARTLTDSVSEVLRKTSHAAEVLDVSALSFLDSSQIDLLVERLHAMISGIKAIDDQTSELFFRLQQGEEALGAAIAEMVSSITFHTEVAAAFIASQEMLTGLKDAARRLVPHSQDKNRPERLKKMLERYTMEVERMIHESAMAGDGRSRRPRTPTARAVTSTSVSSDDLGDNVELF